MFFRTYYLEFERYKSKKKSKHKHKLGMSNRVIRVPFWKTTIQMVTESINEVENTNKCFCYLKRIERIK